MNVEPVRGGQEQQWPLVVRRSFGISDDVGNEEARRALIEHVAGQLEENGWHSSTRAIAEPMMDALIALGASGALDDCLPRVGTGTSAEAVATRDAAHRVIDQAMAVVDPEHLVFDVRSEYPPEVLAVARYALDRVVVHMSGRPVGE